MAGNWSFNENDRMIISELSGMIPGEIFDAHAHIYQKEDLNTSKESIWNEGPDIVDIAVWEKEIQKFFPGALIRGGFSFQLLHLIVILEK